MTKREILLGIDTSNYTTSVAAVSLGGELIANLKSPLSVREGERGLRQSDAVFSHLKNRYDPLKAIFESKPIYLIEHGAIRQSALVAARVSLNELISECRLQGVGDLFDIDFAILEQNGQLSILLKSEKQPLTPDSAAGKASATMHPVVMDGKTDAEELRIVGADEASVRRICRRNRVSVEKVFLLTLDEKGAYRLIKKEET